VYAAQLAANGATEATNVTRPEQRWLVPADDLVARSRRYAEIGSHRLIVEMPAPFDLETLHRLAEDVRPRLG
jgi:hypothetical protein